MATMHNAYDALSHVIPQRREEISPQRHRREYQSRGRISMANRGFRDVTCPIRGFHHPRLPCPSPLPPRPICRASGNFPESSLDSRHAAAEIYLGNKLSSTFVITSIVSSSYESIRTNRCTNLKCTTNCSTKRRRAFSTLDWTGSCHWTRDSLFTSRLDRSAINGDGSKGAAWSTNPTPVDRLFSDNFNYFHFAISRIIINNLQQLL